MNYPIPREIYAHGYYAAGPLLRSVVASNAQILFELAELRASLRQPQPPAVPVPVIPVPATAGSGAGSTAIYEQIMSKHGQGMLGRTNMSDVDRLLPSVRAELDRYLRRTILAITPVGAVFGGINSDVVFATLSAFGLCLEDRDPLFNGPLFIDNNNTNTGTLRRLQNYCTNLYTGSNTNFANYWKALAMETLYQVAKYRGLFGVDGFLVPAT